MLAKNLDTVTRILSQIASTGGTANLDALLAELTQGAETSGAAREAGELASQLATISAALRDNAITDRGMNLLIETAQDLSSTLSTEKLFEKIVSRARTIANANIAWLTMLDEETHVFRNIATEGNLSPGTAQLTASPDIGLVGRIINSQDFFTTADYLGDTRFKHSLALDQQFSLEKIVSLAGFPVVSKNRVEGVLFIADRYSRQYSGREISILGSFAEHVGVALRNARSFTQLEQALDTMDRDRRSLEEHLQRVSDTERTHDDMMSLLARGADLHTFMQRMADQVSGSICYLDQSYSIRDAYTHPDYSGTLAEQIRNRAFDQARLLSTITRSRESGRAEVLEETGDERSLVLALHGGTSRRDCLILSHMGTVDKMQLRNLERSTVALSIAKLWAERRQTEQLIASSTLLRHVVLSSSPDKQTISSVRERLSLGAEEEVGMVVVGISKIRQTAQTDLVRRCANRLNLLIDLIDDDYVGIGPPAEVASLTAALAKTPGNANIGGIVSTPYKQLDQSAATYSRLSRSMRTVQRIAPLRRFLNEDEIGLMSRIFEYSDPERIAAMVDTTLAPIAARDPRNRSNLKRTLLAYFDNQFSLRQTADQLGIHVNTVRQRLETLREITGGWDNDPVSALELHVMLRLDALSQPTG